MKTSEVVIASAVRTPIGSFGGSLRDIPVVQLGSKVISEVLKTQNLRPVPPVDNITFRPKTLATGMTELEKKFYAWEDSSREIPINEVIMGNVLQAGQGQNVARQSAIYGGIPKETNAFTVNKVCASGLKAISLAAQAIMTGAADVIVAGGMESMSNAPYAMARARWGLQNGR